MLQGLAELRSDADGDGFALDGVVRIASQGYGEVSVAAVLGVEVLQNVGFAAGILLEHGVDLFTKSFGFGQGLVGTAIFDVGEVAYETLLEACDTETPAAEGAEFFVASRNML